MTYPIYSIDAIALLKCSRSGSKATSGIINDRLSFEELVTPQEVADYFNLDYRGIVNGDDIEDYYYVKGKVHMFVDHNNNDSIIYVSDDLLEKETGLLKSDWYETEFQEQAEEWGWDEKEVNDAIEGTTYPLRQFFKDYDDIPPHLKECIGVLNLSNDLTYDRNGDWKADIYGGDSRRSNINIYKDAFQRSIGVGMSSDGSETIAHNVKYTLYHELGHGIAHTLEYDNKWGWKWDVGSEYFAKHSKYTNAKKKDKQLNGDKWATQYGESSRTNVEECADVSMYVLLNHLKDKDPNYSRYMARLPYNTTSSKRYLTIDEFLERYPNRAKVMSEVMGIDLK